MHWINTTLEMLSPGWVGAIISFVGIIAAVVTYLLTRQRTRLAYCCAGKRLLGLATAGLPEGITVHYRGQDIPRLTRTLVVLWNAGEKTILGEDIVAADPLRLKLRGDGRVLAATVLKKKRDVCQFEALPDASCPNETHIRFDFLDAGDGAVIEVLHTSEERYMEVLGTVRGLPQGFDDLGKLDTIRTLFIHENIMKSKVVHMFSWLTLATGVAVIMVGLNSPEMMSAPEPSTFSVVLAGALYTLAGIALICRIRRRYPKCLHVEELR